MPSIRSRIGSACLAGLAAVALVACQRESSPDPKLAALEMERIARFIPPGGTLESEGEAPESSVDGATVPASTYRVFVFPTSAGAAAGVQAAVGHALSTRWKLTTRGGVAYGAKTLSTGEAQLTIGGFLRGPRNRIKILLQHRRCPRSLCAG